MRAAQPVRKHRAEINVASALTALEQDAARVVALSISIGRALSAAADDALAQAGILSTAQLRTLEQAAQAVRSHRDRLDKLDADVNGQPRQSLLGSGYMLPPLRSAAEGAEQARRMRQSGHPMYLRDGPSAATTLTPVNQSQAGLLLQSPKSAAAAACTAQVAEDTEALAEYGTYAGVHPFHGHTVPSAAASVGVPRAGGIIHGALLLAGPRQPRPGGRRAQASPPARPTAHGEGASADMHDGDDESGDDAAPAATLGKRCHVRSSSLSTEQQLRNQRDAWFKLARSVNLGPRQIIRAPRLGRTMAEHYSGTHACVVCQQTLWQDAPGFSPLHFMQCGNNHCGDIASRQ